jgi:hypothetical protein
VTHAVFPGNLDVKLTVKTSGSVMISRQLQLAFILSGKPFGWRCSICRRVFVPLGLETTHVELQCLQREFQQHLCWPVTDIATIEEIAEHDKQIVPSAPLVTQI